MLFDDSEVIEIELGLAKAKWSSEELGRFSFELIEKKMFEVLPVNFGVVDESVGYYKKFREHSMMIADGSSVELENILPLGSEPKIVKNYELMGNHIKLITDVQTPNGFSADRLSVDSMSFDRALYRRYAIVNFPKSGDSELGDKIVWNDLPEGDIVLFSEPEPFMVFLLESVDGQVIEVGTGDDFWRWCISKDYPGTTAEFKLEIINNKIVLVRNIIVLDSSGEMQLDCRNWRFKWYIAWETKVERDEELLPPEKRYELGIKSGKSFYDADEVAKPDFTFMKDGWRKDSKVLINKKETENVCFHSNSVRNYYRHLVRSALNRYPNDDISITGLRPHFCDVASHLNRKERESLLHWDILALFDFWTWGNKQTAKNEQKLRLFIKSDNLIEDLPSMRGLSR